VDGHRRSPLSALAAWLSAATAVLGTAGASGAATLSSPESSSTPTTVAPATDTAGTVWLCRPGLSDDPCTQDLRTTVVGVHGKPTIQYAQPATSSPFDCFYVYPTVSRQKTANADLRVQASEIAVAEQQASRFSTVCRVWAPVYRQRTLASLGQGLGGDPQADAVASQSLLAAWQDYLANDNDGRPIIFIGDSQGSAMLIRLLRSQVDATPAVRSRMVSAILLGGNVTVPAGKPVGGTFAHIPICTTSAATGCVIAYSSFPSRPPADALFGRPGQGVSLQSGQTQTKGLAVVCVNPAAPGGGAGALDPYFRLPVPVAGITTAWVAYPGLYSARCERSGGASWLQVDDVRPRGAPGPRLSEPEGPAWGFHALDVNLALGNLVQDVAAEESSYQAGHG
jgi:DUF3089 family protein